MLEVVAHKEGSVTRPLNVLAPLIKSDLARGDEAATQAGMPYYRAAGEKLLEARDGSFEGRVAEFYDWAERNFGRKQTQLRQYVNLVTKETKFGAPKVTSLRDHERSLGRDRPTGGAVRRDWTAPVDDIADRARRDMERIREADLTRAQERAADQTLALRLIEIGFKVLAKELHPDKGGSRDAMARLNRVRDRLKQHA